MKIKIASIILAVALVVAAAPASYAKSSSPKVSSRASSSKRVSVSSTPVKSVTKSPSVVVRKSAPIVVKSTKAPIVSKAPKSSSIHIHKGKNYYFRDSKYYVKSGAKYVRTPPPFGLRVSVLPILHTAFIFNNLRYYCAKGVIYSSQNNGSEYEVVEPEVGMIVPALPEVNVNEVQIDDKIYFEFEGFLYKQIPTESGLMYEVVGSLSI
ncbi:MAG: DUF6515 family protein [Rikenellaceae bacterium]